MKKILTAFMLLFFPLVAYAEIDIATMSIDEKCQIWKKRATEIVDEYFEGVTKDEQYKIIDDITTDEDEAENKFLKAQIDGVYDHIPFVQSKTMRDLYREAYANEIYKFCIDKYVKSKPE